MKVYHVVGYTQWAGTCVFHLYRDCQHFKRPRTTGISHPEIVEAEIDDDDHRVCKHCRKRSSRA